MGRVRPSLSEFERFSSIFSNTGIIKRHGVKPFEWYLEPRGWPERTEAFLEGAEALFVDVAEKALASAQPHGRRHRHRRDRLLPPESPRRAWRRASPAAWVSDPTSRACRCSASAAPAGFGPVDRLAPCRRRGRAATCCWSTIELCSLALRLDELTKANIVAVSLFGDGAAAMVLRAGDGGATEIENAGEHLWPDTLGIMGWSVDPEGFGVIFRRTIPDFVTAHLNPAVVRILADMQLTMADIDRFICHPGGAKVDQRVGDRARARSGHARP